MLVVLGSSWTLKVAKTGKPPLAIIFFLCVDFFPKIGLYTWARHENLRRQNVMSKAGSGVVRMGSRCVCFGFEAWQGMQLCTISSTSLSIPDNHTFSLISCFVLTMPWCEWWAMSIVLFLNLEGIRRRCPQRMRPLITDCSSLNGEKFDSCGSFQRLQLPPSLSVTRSSLL